MHQSVFKNCVPPDGGQAVSNRLRRGDDCAGQYEAETCFRSALENFNEIIITQMAFWYNDALGHLKGLFKVCLKLARKQLRVNRSQAAPGQMAMQISLLKPVEACYNIAMVQTAGKWLGSGRCRRPVMHFQAPCGRKNEFRKENISCYLVP